MDDRELKALARTITEAVLNKLPQSWGVLPSRVDEIAPSVEPLLRRALPEGERIEGWATEGGYDFHFTKRDAESPPWKRATLLFPTSQSGETA